MKAIIFLCFLALAKAGVIETNYAPASVSTVYHSPLNTPVLRTLAPVTYTKTLTAAPVYESVLSTHESRSNNLDGTQQNTYAKSLVTPFSSVNKFDSRTTNHGVLSHSVPVFSSAPVLTQPHAAYSVASPIVHSVASPLAHTVHGAPVLTKTIASPGITSFASHTPVAQVQPVKITYSEAPLVSHMTFTGLGTSYSW